MTLSSKSILNSWVTCPQPRANARLRLFCLPYAGGNAAIYHTWAERLPAEIEVCPLQLPGRGSRFSESLLNQMTVLVPDLAQAILPALQLPFALFGHSMGALIGFELVRYLRRHYRLQPEVFISSGHYAPHLSKPDPALATLPQNRFIEAIRNYNGTPTAFFEDQELMELVLPVLRADFSICETYHYTPEEPLDCPIIAYGGTQDPDADPVDLLAWRDQTHRNVSVRVFPGDHFYIETVSDLLLRSLIKDLREFATPLMERRTRKDSEHE